MLTIDFQGCGKTTLMKMIASKLKKSNRPTLEYYFRASPNPESARPITFVASLLGQILAFPFTHEPLVSYQCQKEVIDFVHRVSQKYFSARECPLDVLSHFLIKVLNKPSSGYVILVDALDEAQVETPLSSTFRHVIGQLQDLAGRGNISLIVSSRSFSSRAEFQTNRVGTSYINLSETENLAQDVRSYIQSRVESDSRLRLFEDIIIPSLCGRDQLVFQLADLSLQELESVCSRADCMRKIEALPKYLDSVYRKIFWSTLSQPGSCQLQTNVANALACMCVSESPLSSQAWYFMTIGELENMSTCANTLMELCQPFLRAEGPYIAFCHKSAYDYLIRELENPQNPELTSISTAQLLIAKKCLSILSRDPYKSLDAIGKLLRKQYLREQKSLIKNESSVLEETYKYAADHWVSHVVKTTTPDNELAKLLADFLSGSQFVYWGQFEVEQKLGRKYPFLETFTSLEDWSSLYLSADQRKLLRLEQFFDGPYKKVSVAYREAGNQALLQWLCLIPVGRWYYHRVEVQKRNEVRGCIVEGLTKILGSEDPLTLQARVDYGYKYIDERSFNQGFEEFSKIASIQARVIGEHKEETLITKAWVGVCQWYLTRFQECLETLYSTKKGLKDISAEHGEWFQTCEYWIAKAMLGLQELEESLAKFEDLYMQSKDVLGCDSIFSSSTEGWVATLNIFLGQLKQAEKPLKHAYKIRNKNWDGLKSTVTVDDAVQLMVLYWNENKIEEENKILKDLKAADSTSWTTSQQVNIKHLEALISYALGQKEEAFCMLEGLRDKIERVNWDRYMFYALLTAARIKREMGDDSDALLLFEGIVKKKQEKFSEETVVDRFDFEELDDPKMLQIAEQATQLVKNGMIEEANSLLEVNCLEWKRQQDLWMAANDPLPAMERVREPGNLGSYGLIV